MSKSNIEAERGQCEGCGTLITEADARVERHPGAVLWFCAECADV